VNATSFFSRVDLLAVAAAGIAAASIAPRAAQAARHLLEVVVGGLPIARSIPAL
jgi:hypothetical protein